MPSTKDEIMAFFKQNLKSVEEIDKGIDFLKNLEDIKNIGYSEFHKLYIENLGVVNKLGKQIKKHHFEKLYIYRVRGVDEGGLEHLEDVKTFMGPPVNDNVGFGRANWKERNVFYGCPNISTALLEKKSGNMLNKEYYVAQWVIDISKIKLDVIKLSSILINNLPGDNPWNGVFKGFSDSFIAMKTNIAEENVESFEHLFNKINDLFISVESDKYPISAYIADQILFDPSDEFPILLYPTRIRDFSDCNLAINPDFVQNYMKLKKVVRIRITDEKKMAYIPLWYSFNNGGKLEWYSMINHDNRLRIDSVNQIICLSNGKVIKDAKPTNTEFFLMGIKIDFSVFIENLYKEGTESLTTENNVFEIPDGLRPQVYHVKNGVRIKGLSVIHKGVEYSNLSLDMTLFQRFPKIKF